MRGRVIIDCFPACASKYRTGYAVIVIDVIRATTTATTAISLGRRVFPVQTTDDAFNLVGRLDDPLLVGELGGNMPYGFDLTNSPTRLVDRIDVHRPMILVSSSGTQLLVNAMGSDAVYAACFRNISAVASHILANHRRVAILGAGSRGVFRREDQMGCAFVAKKLIDAGFECEDSSTSEIVARWDGAEPELAAGGKSAEYLRKSGQEEDLSFIISHHDDLQIVPTLVRDELVIAKPITTGEQLCGNC